MSFDALAAASSKATLLDKLPRASQTRTVGGGLKLGIWRQIDCPNNVHLQLLTLEGDASTSSSPGAPCSKSEQQIGCHETASRESRAAFMHARVCYLPRLGAWLADRPKKKRPTAALCARSFCLTVKRRFSVRGDGGGIFIAIIASVLSP